MCWVVFFHICSLTPSRCFSCEAENASLLSRTSSLESTLESERSTAAALREDLRIESEMRSAAQREKEAAEEEAKFTKDVEKVVPYKTFTRLQSWA